MFSINFLPTETKYLDTPDECDEYPASSTSINESQVTNISDEEVYNKTIFKRNEL